MDPKIKAELTRLVARAAGLKQQKRAVDAALEAVSREIKDKMREHESQIPLVSSSRYWRIPRLGLQARLIYPSNTPVMDYELLRKAVGDELFFEITEPTGYQLVLERVGGAISEERLTDSKLASCLKPAAPREASLYLEAMTPERKDDGEEGSQQTDS